MTKVISYREAVKQSMHSALANHPNTLIYGLGVTDHVGIFGTTLGLEKEFGSQRVLETPISEEAMTGFAVGASLGNFYPIHIHIRNDFMLLAVNQIVNSIAKYRSMYGGVFRVPMLIRAVIGRSWGQGGQHSQSLQSLFAHIPGLTVIMPSTAQTLLDSYDYAIRSYSAPVISLEHRLLYDYSFNVEESESSKRENPLASYVVQEGSDVSIFATSVMVEDAIRAAEFVRTNAGLSVEIIDLHCISHMDEDLIHKSVAKTGRVIVADTSWASFGVCAEVSRIIATHRPGDLKAPIVNISMAKTTCPTSKVLENYFYPNLGDLVKSIYQLCLGSNTKMPPLPTQDWIARQYKEFKGPF